MATNSFPLKWPAGKPATPSHKRQHSRFDATIASSRDELLRELKLLGATHVVISSNVRTYERGGKELMYSDQTAAKDAPGVAVYYQWDGASYCMACDKWKTVAENLQALNKSINAIRGLDRWGTGDMVKAAFSGFKELPTGRKPVRSCWEILNISVTPNAQKIKEAYRVLAKKYHPDNGGSHHDMTELNGAYMDAMTFADSM